MDRVTELLEQLATTLGTTVEYLWGVLIKQQYIEAYVMLIWAIVLLICSVIGYIATKKIAVKLDEEKDPYDVCSERQVAWNIGLPIIVIIILMSIDLFIKTIQLIYNPEYYALQDILQLL